MEDYLKSAIRDNKGLIKIQQKEIKRAIGTMQKILKDMLNTSLSAPENFLKRDWKIKRALLRGALNKMYFRLNALTGEAKRKENLKKGKWWE